MGRDGQSRIKTGSMTGSSTEELDLALVVDLRIAPATANQRLDTRNKPIASRLMRTFQKVTHNKRPGSY
jgi:hypothetical protein